MIMHSTNCCLGTSFKAIFQHVEAINIIEVIFSHQMLSELERDLLLVYVIALHSMKNCRKVIDSNN